jgi:hypothetical protein
MADDPIYSDKDIFEQGASGMVSTLALAAAASGASLPVQGAIAMVGSLVGLGVGRQLYRAAQRRFPLFAVGFLRAYDPDPGKAQTKARQTADRSEDDHHYHDTILRSFRQMMDAADESVIDTLGYLAGVYTFGNRKPDAFFRGLGRLLCDLETGELEELRLIAFLMCKFSGEWDMITAEIDREGHAWASALGAGGQGLDKVVFRHAYHLFALLKREQLGGIPAQDAPKYGSVSSTTDAAVSMPLSMARRILGIVDPLAFAAVPAEDD